MSIEDYKILAGETITVDADERLIIHDEYVIEGTGQLIINSTGRFICIESYQ